MTGRIRSSRIWASISRFLLSDGIRPKVWAFAQRVRGRSCAWPALCRELGFWKKHVSCYGPAQDITALFRQFRQILLGESVRKTYRNMGTFDYWSKRWTDIPADQAMTNETVYPLKHACFAVNSMPGRILEAGCGAGRVLRYFHEQGCDITGIDYVAKAVEKLKRLDASLVVEVADITKLNFADNSFNVVLAFGLYHNFHGRDLLDSLRETHRVMNDGGVLCASFRADNICNHINDWLYDKRHESNGERHFHKLNLTEDEFRLALEMAGFTVEKMEYVENMSLLYKFSIWRASEDGKMHESTDRSKGYELNAVGKFIQKTLMRLFPKSFCNIWVATARCQK